MAVMDRFLQEARVGERVELGFGTKEITGTIVWLDQEIVQVKKTDGRTATVDLAAIRYYEISGGTVQTGATEAATGGQEKQLYQNVLRAYCESDTKQALGQISAYIRQSPSVRARLCYIWILAHAGNTDRARELLSLIPEEAVSESETVPSDAKETVFGPESALSAAEMEKTIVNEYFFGHRPELSECFETLVKKDTLYRVAEHCRRCGDFLLLSPREKQIQAELMRDTSDRINVKDGLVKRVIIKTIYANPTGYRCWHLYSLCMEEEADRTLRYCVSTGLAILCPDPENEFREQAAGLLKTDGRIEKRYGAYRLYNHLYRLYLTGSLHGNHALAKQLSGFSADSRRIFQAGTTPMKLARDYIHLFKLLDNGDNYIYIKSAMFIATNNGCESYFYGLFRTELLNREPVLCVRLCVELLTKKKGKSTREFCGRIGKELKETYPKQAKVIAVLLESDEKRLPDLCRVLRDYPAGPKKEAVEKLLKRFRDDASRIAVLEKIDACYPDAPALKRRLLQLYRTAGKRSSYESMYRTITGLAKYAVEGELQELCRQSALLVTAMGRRDRLTDIPDLYKKYSAEGGYEPELTAFCEVCGRYELPKDQACEKMFDALITGNWLDFFAKYDAGFPAACEGIAILLSASKLSFAGQALDYLTRFCGADREECGAVQLEQKLDAVFRKVIGTSLADVIKRLRKLPESSQRKLVRLVDFAGKPYPFYSVPDDGMIADILLELWDAVCGEEVLCGALAKHRSAAAGYELLCGRAIRFYESRGLLGAYAEYLYKKKRYEEIRALYGEYGWASESRKFAAYYAAVLLAEEVPAKEQRPEAEREDGYIRELTGETFVDVVLLLKNRMLGKELQRLCSLMPERCREIGLIGRILRDPAVSLAREIEEGYVGGDAFALLKLLYGRTDDPEDLRRLRERYGDEIAEHEYAADLIRPAEGGAARYLFEREEEQKTGTKDMSGQNMPVLFSDGIQEDEESEKRFLKDYMQGIKPGERTRISDLYDSLGPDISENPEYRRELLTKLVYLTLEEKDTAAHREYRILHGVVRYYCRKTADAAAGREMLYEAVLLLDETAKRSTVEHVRNAVCDALGSFSAIDEPVREKDGLTGALLHMLRIRMAREFAVFFRQISDYTEQIAEVMSVTDPAWQVNGAQRIAGQLQTAVTRCSTPLFGQIYMAWYRMIRAKIQSLSRGAVLMLQVETTQCTLRGRICCVLWNLGKQPAKQITIRAVFADEVRCRDGEKKRDILYGGDTCAFSFQIRCREEGIQKFRIVLSCGEEQSTAQTEYSREVMLVRETKATHIGNLYSVAPVTSDAEFYGREREKKEIFGFLNDVRYNTSMVMHGLKRVGKTSMLRCIERTLRDSEQYIPVYKSAQGIGEQNAVGRMFVETVTEELLAAGLWDETCRGYLKYDYDNSPEKLYEFYRYLQKSGLLGKKRILFMADEIEEIFDLVDEGRISRRFYKVLRVILQELTCVRFIFCGADQLTDLLYNHALADVFEITKRVMISRLNEEAMQQMITEPAAGKLTYTDQALERVWYYTGGHTFYSKHICSKVIDLLNEEGRETAYAYDIDTAVKQVMRITEYFIYLSRFFRENDWKVIRLMCEKSRFARDRVSLNALKEAYEGRGLTDSLAELEFKDILEKTEGYDEDYYQFPIEMFRLWYAKAEYVIGKKEEAR